MHKRALLATLVLSLGLLTAPATAEANDPEYPVYDVTSFPALGMTIEQRDCAGSPSSRGPAPYRWVWDQSQRADVLELGARSGQTIVGVNVSDTSKFEFWEFGNENIGTVEVVVDLGDKGTLRGTGALSHSPLTRGGTWIIHKNTPLNWTQFNVTHPQGLHIGRSGMSTLPGEYTGPARISLKLSDCAGSAEGTRARFGYWWLDAGAGAQWIANFKIWRRPTVTATTSRTKITRSGTVRLSVAVNGLPSSERARLELWRKVLWASDTTRYTPRTWVRVKSIPLGAGGHASVSVTPTESTSYQWMLVPAGNGIEGARSIPIAVTVAPRMTLALDHKTVPRGGAVTVSGRIDGHHRGTVTLYRRVGPRLVKIMTAPGRGSFDRYSFTFRPPKAGTWKLVTRKRATKEFAKGTSRTVSLRVR